MSFRAFNLGLAKTPVALTTANQTLQVDCEGTQSVLVQMLTAVGLTGCTLIFEGRIDANAATPWITLSAYATDSTAKGTTIAVTPALSAVPANGWLVSLNGMAQFRVRITAITGGSLTLGCRLSDTPYG